MATATGQERRETSGAPPQDDTAGTLLRTSRRREVAAVIALLLLAVVVRLPTLDQPLIEHHEFRQTQTAYTALLYHQDGVDLLHPKLPVFGPPFEVPFEFPLFQAMAAAVMSWGLSPDMAMRTTALACFVLSALLLWGLVRYVGGRIAALGTLALFLFTPFALIWSRASLIEYLAVAGSLGWLWAGMLWRDRRRRGYAAAAIVAGLVGMLVKPTTAALWVLPLLAHTAANELPGWRSWLRERLDPVLALIVVLPFLAAMAWTNHADAIKGASDATDWLTSSQLQGWNFGSIEQRLVGEHWSRIVNRITSQLTLYPAWLLPLAVLVGLRTRNARFWAALVSVAILTILVFWNLYVVHDYYLSAISPVLAAVGGFGVARAWHATAERRARGQLAGVFVVWVAALVAVSSPVSARPYWRRTVADAFPVVKEASRLTVASDLVLFEGYDWSPEVPYYSRRQGYMLRDSTDERMTLSVLVDANYRVLVTRRLTSDLAADTIRSERWTGVAGRWVYVAGNDRGDLRGAPIAATDDPIEMGTNLLSEPVTIPCGQGTVVPRGPGATVLRLAGGTQRSAKLSLNSDLGDVPVRDSIIVAPAAGPGRIQVDCRDAPSVTIVAVGDLPGPN